MDERRAAALQQSIDNGQLFAKFAAKAAAAAKRQWKKPSKPSQASTLSKGRGRSGRRHLRGDSLADAEAGAAQACARVVAGVDFGKVICGCRNDEEGDASLWFGDGYLHAPAVPGAEAGVSRLVQELGARNVFIVSKARQRGRQRTLEWLAHKNFYHATGLARSHVFFCNRKEDKATICAVLGVTAFVDDSVDVLASMPDVPQRLLLLIRRRGGAAREGVISI
eukprot:g3586.t1